MLYQSLYYGRFPIRLSNSLEKYIVWKKKIYCMEKKNPILKNVSIFFYFLIILFLIFDFENLLFNFKITILSYWSGNIFFSWCVWIKLPEQRHYLIENCFQICKINYRWASVTYFKRWRSNGALLKTAWSVISINRHCFRYCFTYWRIFETK